MVRKNSHALIDFANKEGKGILLAVVIGILSILLADYTPSAINSVMIALVAGIFLGNILVIPTSFDSGISLTSGRLLELSIIFLAFSINYTHIAKLGAGSFIAVAVVVCFFFA